MAVSPRSRALNDRQIAGCFNRGLGRRYGARLIGGAPEPLYEARPTGVSLIRYRADYAASALHELAHWCIAGVRRRGLKDYGYWYRPPPRTPAEQAAFIRAEVPVQALEAHLAEACGLPFEVSVDDVASADGRAALEEALAVYRAADRPLPRRGRMLAEALRALRGAAFSPGDVRSRAAGTDSRQSQP